MQRVAPAKRVQGGRGSARQGAIHGYQVQGKGKKQKKLE
jgi:hypothetical protein